MTRLITTATFLLASAFLAACISEDAENRTESSLPPSGSEAVTPVFLEELTWMEGRDAVAAGQTTVLIPTGGVEQNGPHMALGKHNAILRVTMDRVARRLEDALVVPIVAYVPDGDVSPPAGHMRFPGTMTLPNEYFVKLLEYAACSLQAHGFVDIVLIGDSGGNQEGMCQVAELLNEEWADLDARVHFVGEYYSANGFAAL